MLGTRSGTLGGYIAIFLLAALIVTYFYVTAPQRRMGRLLKELANVEVGRTNIADWRKRMRAASLPRELLSCEGGNCTISQKTQVKALSRMRLAPPSVVEVDISFKDGIASEIYVWLEIDDQRAGNILQPGTGATIHETQQSRSCPQHYCAYVNDRSGFPWAVIEVDSGAPKEDRAKAFALNIGCLTKIGGCKSVKSILPQVFGKS